MRHGGGANHRLGLDDAVMVRTTTSVSPAVSGPRWSGCADARARWGT
ncbi:hypothetical protein [Janibacter melonis]|nr:hypothetical protein [Janibacter melonis]